MARHLWSLLAELGSVDCEILELHCQTPIHASFLHTSYSVNIKFLVGVHALVETIYANSTVVTRCPDEPTSFESFAAQRRERAHLECNSFLVAHRFTLISYNFILNFSSGTLILIIDAN